MPELSHLRAALDLLAEQVPDDPATPLLDAVITEARHGDVVTLDPVRRRRHRVVAPLVTVASIVAIAAGVTVVARAGHDDTTPPAAARRKHSAHPAAPSPGNRASQYAAGLPAPAATSSVSLRLDVALVPVPGVTVAPLAANRLFQSESIEFTALHDVKQDVARGGELYVFYRGVFDPSSVPHLAAVDVSGHRGWVTRSGPPSEIAPVTPGTTDGVTWQYAPNSWALLLVDHSAYQALGKNTRAGNLALARAVRARTQVLPLPFRATYIPDGLLVDGASSFSETKVDGTRDDTGQLGLGDGRPRAKGTPADELIGSALEISVETRLPIACLRGCRTVRVGDLKVSVFTEQGQPAEVSADLGTATMTVDVDSAHLGRFSAAELERILAGIAVASDLSDRSTWFDARLSQP